MRAVTRIADPENEADLLQVARALPDLPLISAAMAKGELSFAKVR